MPIRSSVGKGVGLISGYWTLAYVIPENKFVQRQEQQEIVFEF